MDYKKITSYQINLAIFLCLIFCVGCQDHPATLSEEIATPILDELAPIEGVLEFSSLQHFQNAYEEAIVIDEYYYDFTEHKSIAETLEECENLANDDQFDEQPFLDHLKKNKRVLFIDTDSSLVSILEDPILTSFLNQDGVMQIGDTLFIVERDFVKRMHFDPEVDNYASALDFASRYNQTDLEADIFVNPIIREVEDVPDPELEAAPRGCKKKCIDKVGSKRRLKGKLWKVNLFFFKSAGAKSKSQKRKWGFWKKKRVNYISIYITVDGQQNISKSRHNKKKVSKVTSWSIGGSNNGTQVPDFSLPLKCTHKMTNADCRTCK